MWPKLLSPALHVAMRRLLKTDGTKSLRSGSGEKIKLLTDSNSSHATFSRLDQMIDIFWTPDPNVTGEVPMGASRIFSRSGQIGGLGAKVP